MINKNFDILKVMKDLEDLKNDTKMSPENKIHKIKSYMHLISENVPGAKQMFDSKINEINNLLNQKK